jgi:hypothetical protein
MSAQVGTVHHPDWSAIAVGLFLLIGSLFWVLDPGGVATRILQVFYKWRGSLLWPFGSERSYVLFMRYGALFVLVVAALLVFAGIAHR